MGAVSLAGIDHYLSITIAGLGHYLSITSLIRRPALALGAESHAGFVRCLTITNAGFGHYFPILSCSGDLPLRRARGLLRCLTIA